MMKQMATPNLWRNFSLLLLFLLTSVSATLLNAAPAEFEFYFQRVSKKVEVRKEVAKAEPGFFNKIKWAAKKVGYYAKSVWNGLRGNVNRLREQWFPAKGATRVYSRSNPNIAWNIKRYQVKTEKDLLKVMGVTNMKHISNKQKGVLESFRFAKSDFLQRRSNLSYHSKIRFYFTESGNYSNDADFSDDFWPHSRGNIINIGDNYFSWRDPEEAAKTLIAHEFSHSFDRTSRESGSYGPDDSHYVNEITAPRAAWVEGWAIFNEMVISEDEKEYVLSRIKKVKLEKDKAGDYEYFDADSPKLQGKALLNTEGYISKNLYLLYSGIPDSEKKILKAFSSTNTFNRSIGDFLQKLVEQNPKDAKLIYGITDHAYLFKVSDDNFSKLFGGKASVKDYLFNDRADWKEGVSKEEDSAQIHIKPMLIQKDVPVSGDDNPHVTESRRVNRESDANPNQNYGDAGSEKSDRLHSDLATAFASFQQAKNNYKKAVLRSLSRSEIIYLKELYIKEMTTYRALLREARPRRRR